MSAPDEIEIPAPPTRFSRKQRLFLVGGIVVALIIAVIVLLIKSSPAGWQGADIHNAHALTILPDPAHPESVFAGTEDGQILKTTDHGQTWKAISSGIPSGTAISALLATPDDARFFAGTSAGVFVSLDQGKTWTSSALGLPTDDGVDALALDPQQSKVILAGTELHGVYRSSDSGAHWTASASGLPARADVYGLAVAPDGSVWYAALIGMGVFRSADHGATWQSSNAGLPAGVNAFAFAATQDTKHTVNFLLVGTSAGAFVSADGGQTWQAANKGLPPTRVISLSSDAGDPSEVFAGTDVGVYGSVDGGHTWYAFNQGITAQQPIAALAVSRPANQTATVFAAADRLYHYPGQANQTVQNLIRIITIGLLLIGLTWMSTRQNRIIKAMIPPDPVKKSPTAPSSAAAARSANRSNIRGGPLPRAPSTIPTQGGAVAIATDQGFADGIITPLTSLRVAVIMLAGANGGVHGPADAYPELASQLADAGVTALRLEYRRPGDLAACVTDVRAAIAALHTAGVDRVALLGHSFGGAVAIAAGAADDLVAGVAAIAPHDFVADDAARLAPKSLLLLHGTEDDMIPSRNSQMIFAQAREPKELVLYPGDDHALTGHHAELLAKLLEWLQAVLLRG